MQPNPSSAVRLLPGSAFYDRQQLHRRGYLASLDPDRLLFHYRAVAGLPQPDGVTRGYEGWDSGFLRGHMAGHYLSAASRMAVATGDSHFRKQVAYMVRVLVDCQRALALSGYLAAFPPAVFDWLEGKAVDNGGIVVPYYTVHKLIAGMLDAHVLLAIPQALPVVEKMANYFAKRCAALDAPQLERIFRTDQSRNPQNEFGAMSDVLAQLFEVTGNRSHLDLAQLFNRAWFVDPLARGEDRLPGLHANTHIAAAIGLARCANLSGDVQQRMAAENFWRLVTRDHSFVNGGNSFNEWFDRPGVETGASIDGGKPLPATTAESCNTHNMLKLTALLFANRADAGYADFQERALYNHLLATVAPDTGAMTYFMPMRGNFRTFLDGTFCCTGTGIENTPRYGDAICFRRQRDLWFNLYIPAELDWGDTGWSLRQEGDITRAEAVRITIVKAATGLATLNFRIPLWVSAPAILELNGSVYASAGADPRYISIKRKWRAGDVVRLTLPASLRIERAKDDPSMVAVFFGPVLLAGELGRANMPGDFADKDANLKVPAVEVPDIASASANPVDWLHAVPGESLAFTAHAAGPASGRVFRPLYDIRHQRFSIYWRMRPT
ncbi:MAG: beta-L-arabinofuranosidase domain-containing protein [Pseudomonadota bacterium]